jgi:hypothetical protein
MFSLVLSPLHIFLPSLLTFSSNQLYMAETVGGRRIRKNSPPRRIGPAVVEQYALRILP